MKTEPETQRILNSMTDVSMNRPVHLARRDRFYERALVLLAEESFEEPLSERVWRVEKLIFHLQSAYKEGIYAKRGIECVLNEVNFLKVLELVLDSAKAVQAMVSHENLLEEDKSFLHQFLGESLAKINEDENTYRKRAKDILKGIQDLTKTAQKSFEKIKKENLKELSEEGQQRYEKTIASLS